MFSLLRDLRRLRLDIDLAAPPRGQSLAVRHVDAGSCNGCEHELTLVTSPHYDLQRYGLDIVASPRHADVLLVTGPVTTRMRQALLTAYEAMPEPRRVVALGNCALGCALLGVPEEMVGRVDDVLPVDLRIPGCPPHPRAIADGLLRLLDGATTPPTTAQGVRADRRWPARGGDSSEPGREADGVSDG
jgi:Ni,Fe-hydrogenase III small subunit